MVELGPTLLSWVPCGLVASFALRAFSSATDMRVVSWTILSSARRLMLCFWPPKSVALSFVLAPALLEAY